MNETAVPLKKGNWIRFQRKADLMVLEGFVQELSCDAGRVRIGKAVDSPENAWHALSEITVLHQQSR